MKIHTLPGGDVVHHYKKSIVITFSGKRHVLSTGPNNGGYREDLKAVFNHDANPGAGMACVMRAPTYEGHMNIIALEDLGMDPALCSGLCTAASMKNVSIRTGSFRDLSVTAIVTGGIEHNGGRAGDPATFYEDGEDFLPLKPGTINILLHINADLDAGTLARAMVTCTEAKTAAIGELMAPSCFSRGIATGSGTDGTIVICNPQSGLKLTNAGKNSKLGELIGTTVIQGVKEALKKQSGLSPETQHDILCRMGRYGVTEDTLWSAYSEGSPLLSRASFMDVLDQIRKDPVLVTCSSLYAHLLDQLDWGLLSYDEVLPACGSCLARMTGPADPPDQIGDITEDIARDREEQITRLSSIYLEKILGIIEKNS